jgi:hypothetical protein
MLVCASLALECGQAIVTCAAHEILPTIDDGFS